jgi:hypothetical protein
MTTMVPNFWCTFCKEGTMKNFVKLTPAQLKAVSAGGPNGPTMKYGIRPPLLPPPPPPDKGKGSMAP